MTDIFMEENVNKEPYIKVLTKDKVINLTGQSGSGKSYYAKNNFDSDKYLVVDTDDIFDEKRFNESSGINRELGKFFRKKYVELPDIFTNVDLVYEEILDYCKKNYKDKIVVFYCALLYWIKDIKKLKGKIIIMRTSIETCLERVINRYKKNNPNHTEEELNKYIKRKKGIYVWYKYFNEFISKIDNL